MNNVLLLSGFDCSTGIGTLQKKTIKILLGFHCPLLTIVSFSFSRISILFPLCRCCQRVIRVISSILEVSQAQDQVSKIRTTSLSGRWATAQDLVSWSPAQGSAIGPGLGHSGHDFVLLIARFLHFANSA